MDILRVYCAIQVNRPRLPVVLLVGLSVLLCLSVLRVQSRFCTVLPQSLHVLLNPKIAVLLLYMPVGFQNNRNF